MSLTLCPPQFFWQEMFDMVHARLGTFADVLIDGLSPWERTMIFAWRSRPNCHNCYNQSLWEWVGLLEHEPETFAWNEAFEIEIGGSDQREKAFTFKQGWPLARIQAEKEIIKRKRCIKICKLIMKRARIELPFGGDEDDDDLDLLDVVPCGLFCGK